MIESHTIHFVCGNGEKEREGERHLENHRSSGHLLIDNLK